MKKLVVLSAIALLATTAFADRMAVTLDGQNKRIVLKEDGTWQYADTTTSDTTFHFRKTRWGMTKESVQTSESADVANVSEKSVVYKTKLAGFDVLVVYIFVHDQLVRSKYILNEKHSNKTEFTLDYRSLQKLLSKKYGAPLEDEIVWLNDLYRDNPESWGMAVSVGHLRFYAKWNDGNTTVYLYLNGDNYKINSGIEYRSIQLAGLEEQADLEQALDDL